MSKLKKYFVEAKERIKTKKKTFALYLVLRLLVILTMIGQFFNGNYENVFLCALTLLLFLVPSFIESRLLIELPSTLEVIILLFIFSAEILGEIQSYYILFPFWDTVLHTMNGFLAAAIGFCLADVLNRSDETVFKLSPAYLALVAFCFSMTIGVLWEFFEFTMDTFFGLDMQKDTVVHTLASVNLGTVAGSALPQTITDITSVVVNGQELGLGGYLDIGLIDTMQDLFVNFIGASVFSTIGYFYVKNRSEGKDKKNWFAERFIPRVKKVYRNKTEE